MTSIQRDANRVPVWCGVSSTDGVTLIPIQMDSSTGAVKVENDITTMPVMSALPTSIPRDANRVTIVAGVSSADSTLIIPVSVNPATGALQVQTT